MSVAVVGIGIHPFGRHEGVSGLEMAAVAARAALRDAGVGWQEVEFAAGGSDAAGNADTTVSVLGLTGVPFINVSNGCATGGSALATAHAMLTAGAAEIALVVGFDKHPPGAFNPRPEDWGLGSWYGETGLMLTTQFFAMKIQRYMAEHGISRSTLAKVASKAFDNGALNPSAWRRRPLTEEEVLSLDELALWLKEEAGYQWLQGTRPQTLAFALTDSPAGLAAWIVEKFRAWSDCGGDVESIFTKDHLLANISLYWFTSAIGSSFWPYYARLHGPWPIPESGTVGVPTGYSEFPREMLRPPRSLAERTFTDIRRWNVMPRGGHFAAMEQPDALAQELREFFRPLRDLH